MLGSVFLALAACSPGSPVIGGDSASETGGGDGDSGATELVGPNPDTGAAEPTFVFPGVVTVECATAPPLDGKTTCDLTIADAEGRVQYAGPAGMGVHGRSSANFPKPQWAVELRDETGLEAPADLFGMGKESDWLLNGMWIDRALLRNKLAYDLYRELTDDAEWAPESRCVEVTYNGDYYGVFALVERVDRAKGRLDLPADDGTGSVFIVKADEQGIPSSVQYGHWAIQYPTAPDDVVTAGVTDRLATLEHALTYADPAMFDDLDMDSAVAFVLIEELFKNNDAFFLSHHLYVRPDGKLGYTPWDLDLSLGQPSYNDNENPESWIAYRPGGLIDNMGQVPAFRDRMVSMWAEWRASELADGEMEARIDGIVAELGDAVDRNFARWPIGDVDFGGTLYAVGSHEEEIARVKTFVRARIAYMDANVARWSPYADAR